MDRYFFRRYIRTLLAIFMPACLTITPILIPINYMHGKGAINGVRGLDELGWSNVGLEHSDRYWVHFFLGLILIGTVAWVVWVELEYYIRIRQRSRFASSRTVLIDSIPKEWSTSHQLEKQLQNFPGTVETILFNRNYTSLSRKVRRREQLTRSLEAAETALIRRTLKARIRKGDRKPRVVTERERMRIPPIGRNLHALLIWLKGEKVDAISFYRTSIHQLNRNIEEIRSHPESIEQLPSAFVTFSSPLAAHMACQTVIHSKAGYMTPRTLPIAPEDVVWDNVSIGWRERTIRTVISNTLIATIALLCVIPVSFAGLLSQIIYLTKAVSWLSWIDDIPEWALGAIQGLVPPLLLAVLLKLYSSALLLLVRKQGLPSKSLISLKVQDYYFFFLLTQITLVVTLTAGITAIMNEVSAGGSIAATLAKNVPKASNYFLAYVLLQALSVSASTMLRIDRLVQELILSPIFDRTVSQKLERKKTQEIEWGCVVPTYTNLACIGTTTSHPISHPLIPLKGFFMLQSHR